MMTIVAERMNTPQYAKKIYRIGDTKKNSPYTLLRTDAGGLTVVLPLPTNLSSNMGADWQQEEVGMGKFLTMHNKDRAEQLISSKSFKDTLESIGAEAWRGGDEDIRRLYSRSRNTSSSLGGTRVTGNPRNEMLFNGMPFKSYSFNFNLIPYRKQDSDDIMETIRAIQKASAPAMRGEKMFMEYPNTWFVEFFAGSGSSGNKYLMKLNECCCTAVNINYTPQSDSSNLHEDNAPLSIELGLDFTEIFIPTKETIEDGFNG